MAHILIVEDNELNRDMLARRLRKRGFVTSVAVDGEDAIRVLAEDQQPDLILMDLSLPKMDGWETTRQIKANPDLMHIPVMALTAHASRADERSAIDAGCDDFETKPINFPNLLEKIGRLLG